MASPAQTTAALLTNDRRVGAPGLSGLSTGRQGQSFRGRLSTREKTFGKHSGNLPVPVVSLGGVASIEMLPFKIMHHASEGRESGCVFIQLLPVAKEVTLG